MGLGEKLFLTAMRIFRRIVDRNRKITFVSKAESSINQSGEASCVTATL